MGTKVCTVCGEEKPITEYHKRSAPRRGRHVWCKKCQVIHKRKYRWRNQEEVNRKDRERHIMRPKPRRKNFAKYCLAYPERIKANRTLAAALAKNEIRRPLVCERCDRKARIIGHHDDYSKPLDVMWLCQRCHYERHQELKQIVAG